MTFARALLRRLLQAGAVMASISVLVFLIFFATPGADPAALAGRFERLDAAIGEAASHLPSRQEGKSVVDELGQKVAELVRRAVDGIRNVFQQEQRPGAAASSSPSPGP